jgi:LysR family cyn operon transcriptional activator
VELYPAIRVIVTEATTRDVEEGLLHGEFDLGMVFQASDRDDFQALKLFKEDLFVIVSIRNPIAESPTLRIRDLEKLPLALPTSGFSTRQLIDACFAAAHIRPHIVLETNDIDALLAVVRLGAAATLVSRRVVAHLKDVAAIPLKEKGLQRTAALIWRKEHDLIPAAVRFIEMARKILGVEK